MLLADDSHKRKNKHSLEHFHNLLTENLPGFLASNEIDYRTSKVELGEVHKIPAVLASFTYRDTPVSLGVVLHEKNIEWVGNLPIEDVLAKQFSEKIYDFIDECSK